MSLIKEIREYRLMKALLKETVPYFKLFVGVISLDEVVSTVKMEMAKEFLSKQFPFLKEESISSFLEKALTEYRKKPKLKIDLYCEEITSTRKLKYENLRNMMKYLFLIAYDSLGIEEKEITVLRQIARNLGLLKWDLLSLEYEFEYRLCEGERRKKYQKENNARWKQEHEKQGKEDDFNTRQQLLARQRVELAYEVLSLPVTCGELEIKQAYRLKAKQFHPDALPKDCTERELELATEQFRQVTEAYNYLCTIREIK